MRCFVILILILSSVVSAKLTVKEKKLVIEAGESIGVDLSFSREISASNVKQKCLAKAKKMSLDIKKTEEIETIAASHCFTSWKSLQ